VCDCHAAFLYVIAVRGSVLVLYPQSFEPSWVVHGAPLRAGA
jgi:hypothetical protein